MLHCDNRMSKLEMLKKSRRAILKQFGRDEDGSIIIMTILLLIVMLVLGGMAVDFMRFESRRALLQSVSDRAVLSAASLDQSLDGEEVVIDFFEKSGFPDSIIGRPQVDKEPGRSASSVSVQSQVEVDTFYLRLIGIDTLTAPASSEAIQGTGNVEISLVLDISGSMSGTVTAQVAVIDEATGEPLRDDAGNVIRESEKRTKISLLQDAASGFVDDVINVDYADRISLNLIAYSQQVALDDDLYKALRISPDSISLTGKIGNSYGSISEDAYSADGYATLPEDPDAPIDVTWAEGEPVFTNPARCIDFRPEDFTTTVFDVSKTYEQVEYFEHFRSSDSGIDFPVCPQEEFESILLLSQNADELKRRIGLFRPTSYTSIHLGVKWGVSLLDPSLRPVLANIASIDDTFQGSRPSDYGSEGTLKYLIVMTDGENYPSYRIKAEAYDTYEERVRWSEYPMDYWISQQGWGGPSRGDLTNTPGSVTEFNTQMVALCSEAKRSGVVVFTIAMDAGSEGAAAIAKCASENKAFSTDFNADGDDPGIDEIFETIAKQITALRLNL